MAESGVIDPETIKISLAGEQNRARRQQQIRSELQANPLASSQEQGIPSAQELQQQYDASPGGPEMTSEELRQAYQSAPLNIPQQGGQTSRPEQRAQQENAGGAQQRPEQTKQRLAQERNRAAKRSKEGEDNQGRGLSLAAQARKGKKASEAAKDEVIRKYYPQPISLTTFMLMGSLAVVVDVVTLIGALTGVGEIPGWLLGALFSLFYWIAIYRRSPSHPAFRKSINLRTVVNFIIEYIPYLGSLWIGNTLVVMWAYFMIRRFEHGQFPLGGEQAEVAGKIQAATNVKAGGA
jgi:hypothetical protein